MLALMKIIRTLLPAEFRCYRDHLCRLDAEARRFRFGSAVSDVAIAAYVDGFDGDKRRVIAAYSDAVTVIGAVEMSSIGDRVVELAFSVEHAHRRSGLGRTLFDRAMIAARNRRVDRLLLAVQMENVAMRRMVTAAGGRFELFDGLAECEIGLPAPTPSSILREARAEQAGGVTWLAAAAWHIAATGHVRFKTSRTATPVDENPALPHPSRA